MKPKYLINFFKSASFFDISQRFNSIKVIFDNFQTIAKSLFFKINSHLFNLLGKILFLSIILLFLFLLSIYFSQIKFLKKHSNIFDLSTLNFNRHQRNDSNFLLINKSSFQDSILSPKFFKSHCFCRHPKQLKISPNIKTDYG